MNDQTLWKVLWGLLAVVTGILGWLGKRHVDRLDELDREAVRHHDLKELEARLMNERMRMHEENQQRFREIREDIGGVNNRIERVLFRGGDR